MNELRAILGHWFTAKHKTLQTGPDTIIWLSPYGEIELNLQEVASMIRSIPDELAEFIAWLSTRVLIPGVRNMSTEFNAVLRTQNIVTVPMDIINRLGIQQPAYGTIWCFELKRVILRDGSKIEQEQLERSLSGGECE